MQKQPPHTIKPSALVSSTSFDVELFKLVAHGNMSQNDAFEILNDIHTTEFGRPRYASFNSYVVTRSRRLKN